MKPKTLVLMVVAVTCGLGASYMTSRLLAQRGQSDDEKVTVWVASKNLDQGITLKNPADCFEAKEFIAGNEPKETPKTLDEVKGKVLKRSLIKGDAVRSGDLLSQDQAGLNFIMPAGHLAVGIRVNMQTTAGGFASLPLSRVDVISTVRRGSDRDSFATILLENVLVLAVDTNTGRDPEGRAMPGNVVVLALKPEDALKVEIAKEMGPLSLGLRKFNETVKRDVDRVTFEQLMTKNFGKGDEAAEEYLTGTGQPPIAKAELPKLPKDVAPKAADIVVTSEDPKHKVHRLTIIEGEQHKTYEYYLDEKGNVILPDVARSDVGVTAPPRPAPTLTPPRPETVITNAPDKKD